MTAARKKTAKRKTPLDRITEICLSFPAAARTDSGHHADFRVSTKPFAYYLDNHHGDGRVALCVKTARGENHDYIASDPKRFYSPPYIGPQGWVAFRVDVGVVPWKMAADLIEDSYRLTAPKKLLAQLGERS